MSAIDPEDREKQLLHVDWSTLPQPMDDSAAKHLPSMPIPPISMRGTDGNSHQLSSLSGLSVVFAYPRTGRPDQALPDGWNDIPGARGCTPQACSIRDALSELHAAGVEHVFGLSTQDGEYQKEAAERLHLPYPLLSDEDFKLTRALRLPTMEVEGMTLIKRLTIILRAGIVEKVFYPVFPPDRAVAQVIDWTKR